MMKHTEESSSRDFVLVDLRRNDYEVTLNLISTLYL
jgi:hypothetical protein